MSSISVKVIRLYSERYIILKAAMCFQKSEKATPSKLNISYPPKY